MKAAKGEGTTTMTDPTQAAPTLDELIEWERDVVDQFEKYVTPNSPGEAIARAILRSLETLRWRPTHRHVGRGTDYQMIGEAIAQCDEPIHDDDPVTVYRGEDGRLWVRPPDEFLHGRFRPLPPPPETAK